MRPSVSLGRLLQAGGGGGERAGRLLDRADRPRRWCRRNPGSPARSACAGLARVLATNCRWMVPMIAASHMIACVEQLGVGGDRRRREPVVPRDHVGHPPHHHAAGVEPDARLHADGGVLARRILAVFGIGIVELAREQLPVLRELEFVDAGAVLGEVGGDLRNLRRARDEGSRSPPADAVPGAATAAAAARRASASSP